MQQQSIKPEAASNSKKLGSVDYLKLPVYSTLQREWQVSRIKVFF
jgi:hypothetical protein